MPSREEFIKKPTKLKFLVNGMFGTGKSRFSMTMPRVGYVGTEPNGIEFLHLPENKDLLANLVEYEECYADPTEQKSDFRLLVEEPTAICPLPPLAGATAEGGLIYKALRRMWTLAREGKIDTLVLDNLTYTSEMLFQYLEKHRAQAFLTDKGLVEKRQMYGYLSNWLYRFLMTSVVNFPGHVVVTCHLKSESEEKLKKKKDASVEVVPNILGGFRDKAEGLFTASLYLERKQVVVTDKEGQKRSSTQYWCYTSNQMALGSKILAKNRHGLPPIMKNISYQSIMEHINGKKEGSGGATG